MKNLTKMQISVIGCGNLGAALIRGFCNEIVDSPQQIVVFDSDSQKVEQISNELSVRAAKDPASALRGANIVVFALKPDVMLEALAQLKKAIASGGRDLIIVSVAARITITQIREAIGSKGEIVRVMPNTPSRIGFGMAGVYSESKKSAEIVAQLFTGVGEAYAVSREDELNIITGLSASGPAYVYAFIDALADGGVKMGLQRDVALRLATETVVGASMLLKQTGEHPAILRDEVVSPGGTTIAGLYQLDKNGFRASVISAVEAATKRAREIA